MEKRALGKTGMKVTILGYGAMELDKMERKDAAVLLNTLLDRGVNFIDTSPCYGKSETFIGEIAGRRDEFLLSTKCGCMVGDNFQVLGHDFNRKILQKNIDDSLRAMKTDYVDILQLHAPIPDQIPEGPNDDIVKTLFEMKASGKIRHIGISFRNGAPTDVDYPDRFSLYHLAVFKEWKIFDSIQLVYGGMTRKCEQGIELLAREGIGVIARGTLKDYTGKNTELFKSSGLDQLLEPGMDMADFLIRYTISHPDVSTAIIGTGNIKHLQKNVEAANRGPLSPEVYQKARECLDKIGQRAVFI